MITNIVTLYGEFNYGNRLQNYALQVALESLGCDVKSIVVIQNKSRMKRFLKRYIEKNGKRITLRDKKERRREENFSAFTQKTIKTEYYYETSGQIPSEAGHADCYVVGSDQVWNPLFWDDSDDAPELFNFLLSFTKKRKVAYAASFGISKLPKRWMERLRPLINEFDAISVRENDAANIVSDFGKTAEVVLDPTLLLTAKEWRKVESHIIKASGDYILLYFLGKKPDNLKFEEEVHVIDLLDKDSSWYTSGPEVFIELIDKAGLVYTDSFHAVVFSMIFHTPFIVFNREHSNKSDMSGRIKTLLEIAGMNGGISREKHIINYPADYNDDRISFQRERSVEFLRSALS